MENMLIKIFDNIICKEPEYMEMAKRYDEEVEKIVNKNATQLLEAFNKNPYMFSSLRDALNYNPIKTRK